MGLCDICLGLGSKSKEEKIPGGDSAGPFWEESRLFWGKPPGCEYVLDTAAWRKLPLRERYDMVTMYDPAEDMDDLHEVWERIELEKARIKQKTFLELADGDEDKALKLWKFYDVEVYPRDVKTVPQEEGVKLDIDYDLVVKPKMRPRE